MIQIEIWKEIGNVASKSWSAVGPLVGVLVGGWIATRTQRKHWILDSKRLEFRELFATLMRSYSAIVSLSGPGVTSGEEERRREELTFEALNTIRDRVVIGPEVRRLNLAEQWDKAVSRFDRDRDYAAFSDAMQQIMAQLRQSADKLIE